VECEWTAKQLHDLLQQDWQQFALASLGATDFNRPFGDNVETWDSFSAATVIRLANLVQPTCLVSSVLQRIISEGFLEFVRSQTGCAP
jgi:hypothetical protein